MPLSVQQRQLVLSAFVRLAQFSEGAGETISQQAAKGAGAAGVHAGGGRGGAGHKVASAQGVAHYHLPIGSLIIPHQHFIKGEPSHFSGNISEASWIAHQWKGKPEADKAAHEAVNAGTHHWESVGKNEFAVHNSLETHVPKSTNLNDPVAVKNAPKVFVKKGGDHPEHLTVHPNTVGEPFPHTSGTSMESWKRLPQHQPQKSVSFDGKHAGWVPHDWKVYQSADKPEGQLAGKWAQDPQGGWHIVHQDGHITNEKYTAHSADEWVKSGKLKPAEGESEDHGMPPATPGAQPGKHDVGGVAVSKEEMKHALNILGQDKSTAVKQPLAKAGHPLAAMDYHAVAKEELAKYPELKVAPGTKKAHVGQVKGAIIHHLAGRIQHLSNSEAEAEVAKQAEEKAKAEAEHAKELTPHTASLPTEAPEEELPGQPPGEAGAEAVSVPKAGGGTIDASKEDVQEAIDTLNASKSTAIKQTLTKAGNSLASVDYWAVIHAYEAAHPNTSKGKGTKQAHVGNAKAMFIQALQEKAGGLAKADQATGHDDAAELYGLVTNGTLKENVNHNNSYAISAAAMKAVKQNHNAYAFPIAGSWATSFVHPSSAEMYYKVTPELKLYSYNALNPEGKEASILLWNAAHMWIEPKQREQPEALKDKPTPEPDKPPTLNQVLTDVKSAVDWTKNPEWSALHAAVEDIDANTDVLYPHAEAGENPKGNQRKLALGIWKSHAMQQPYYLANLNGYKLVEHPPAPGSYAANSAPWWSIFPDHRVYYHSSDGEKHQLTASIVQNILTEGIKRSKGESLPDPAPEGLTEVWVQGKHVGDVPAGSKFYTGAGVTIPLDKASKYVQYPNGDWHMFNEGGGPSPLAPGYTPEILAGPQTGAAGVFEIPLEAAEGKVEVKEGEHTYWAPPGSAVFQVTGGTKYVRHPDGSWATVDAYNGVEKVSAGNWKTLNDWAQGVHQVSPFKALNGEAEVFAGEHLSHVLEKIKALPAEEPKADVKVYLKGVLTASFPAGTQVYYYTAGGTAVSSEAVKFVKKPDGSWHYVFPDGKVSPAPPGESWDEIIAGSNQAAYKLEPHDPGTGLPANPSSNQILDSPQAEEPDLEDVPEASEPEKPKGIPALYMGEVKGEWPAGTKLYHKMVGSYQGTYGKAPDGEDGTPGKWYKVNPHGVSEAGTYMVNDTLLNQQGALEPEEPPTAEQVAAAEKVTKLKTLVKKGSLDPQMKVAGSSGTPHFKHWQQAALYKMATDKTDSDFTIVVSPEGNYYSGYLNSGKEEHYAVSQYGGLKVKYQPSIGEPTDVPLEHLYEAAARYVVPDSVVVDGHQYKVGFWKKPKSTAYIEIKAANPYYTKTYKYGTAAHGDYTYYGADGSSKPVTPAYAAKYLDGGKAEHFTEEPKPGAPKAKAMSKVEYAAVAEPGMYLIFSHSTQGPAEDDSIELKSDGSAILSEQDPIGSKSVTNLLLHGTILDQHGTSVVKPGIDTQTFHLFGGHGRSREELEKLKADIEAGGSTGEWTKAFSQFVHDDEHQGAVFSVYQHKDLVKAYLDSKLDGNASNKGDAQRNIILGLVKELLAVPHLPEDAKLNGEDAKPKEVVYLKSLPAGIAKAADVFTFTQTGYVMPYEGTVPAKPQDLAVPELKEAIAKISQQFGDGKIVGTHLTMPKYSLVDWLTGWKQGDMQMVFELDSGAGKVSPAHPGAPGNKDTHHLTWSPADPHQEPASKDIEGTWSNLEYGEVPNAEAANYLIKMNFQHADFLHGWERQAVVKAHREHNQDQVDHFTRLAKDRSTTGMAPLTSAPEWTDGLKPAHPYDVWLQKQSPATEWTSMAVKAFLLDHKDELEKYAQEVGDQYGYNATTILEGNSAYSLMEQTVQKWLEGEHAKQVAEQMVPVWKQVDTGQLPSHGHPVFKGIKTIPYTGEQTTWFVKPAPDGKTFRIEQEHGANKLGSLFGFRTAESQLMTDPAFGSGMVQAQKAVAGDPLGQYTDMPAWDSFSPQEIADMASEHMLDWVLANDDTSANNMIRTPDGHLVGIDKGRSWGNMDWKGLAGDKAMDSMTQLVYTKMYDAIRTGKLSKETADQAYIAVIQKARKMAKVSDATVRATLEEAFAHRPAKYGDKEELINEVLRRKNNLEEDFHKLWAKVYKDAGFGEEKSDFGKDMPWGEGPVNDPRYGMVVFNEHGQVLLREPKDHYNATSWTFAKGGPNKGESPLQAAIREAAEETQYKFTPVGYVPGGHGGSQTTSYYYIATAKGAKFTPELDNNETTQTKWVSVEEAHALLDTSENEQARARDHAVLDAAWKQWGSKGKGKYNAKPLADPHGLESPLPEVPIAKLPDAPGGHKLYSGFSEDGFTEHVTAAKTHGVPVFFGGPELKDMHVLVWQQKDANGKVSTKGETFLKGEGYNKAISWLQQHAKGKTAVHNDTTTTYNGSDGMPGQAPPDSPNRGGIDNERQSYNTIVKAARTVSRHKSDGKYNADTLNAMEELDKQLSKQIEGADAALASVQDEKVKQQVANLKAMSQHYQGLIAQVRKAKEGSYGFTHGDLPRWVAPDVKQPEEAKDDLAKMGIKVTYGGNANSPKGDLGEDGHFTANGVDHTDPGHWWKVTLPGGEVIEVGNGDQTNVQLTHHGRVRFTTPEHSAASMERIRQAMQLMGLEMREAEEHDFETYYWRHLLAMLDDRKDGHTGARQQVWDTLKEEFTKHGIPWTYGSGDGHHTPIIKALTQLGEANAEKETDAYRRAFAKLTSDAQVADWAQRGGFLPHVKHFDPNAPTITGGKPDWYRFDLADKIASMPAPIRQSTNESGVANVTVKNGGTYGLDALMRVVGKNAGGLGNPYDTGGPAYVFTRLNVSSASTMWSPLALARSHNYSFSGDTFGRWNERKGGAAWDSGVWSKYSGGSNETMINDAMSLLDDMELVKAYNSTQRAELIKWLKDRGITHIRFMPVEDRIVLSIGSAEKAKVKQNWKEHPELLDPLAEPGVHQGAEAITPAPQVAAPAAAPSTSSEKPAWWTKVADNFNKELKASGYSHKLQVSGTGLYIEDKLGSWWHIEPAEHMVKEHGNDLWGYASLADEDELPNDLAEYKAADTEPAAAAADAGAGYKQGNDPHLDKIVGDGKYGSQKFDVYQPGNPNIYWVKFQQGGWYEYNVDDFGKMDGPYPAEPEMEGELDHGSEAGGNLTKVYSHGGTEAPKQGKAAFAAANGDVYTLPSDWEVYKDSGGGVSNAVWAKDPDGVWWKVNHSGRKVVAEHHDDVAESYQEMVDDGTFEQVQPAGAKAQTYTAADGETSYDIPAGWAAYKSTTMQTMQKAAVWAKDPEGNWWKWNKGDTTPTKVGVVSAGSADDYGNLIAIGDLVPASQGWTPVMGAHPPDTAEFFKTTDSGVGMFYVKAPDGQYWLVNKTGTLIDHGPSKTAGKKTLDPVIMWKGKLQDPGSGGSPPF